MLVYATLQYCLIAVFGLLLGYSMLLSFSALRGKKNRNFETGHKRKFAVVVLSHNGIQSLTKTLYSLSGLVYPRNRFDLIVVADPKTEISKAITDKFGITVVKTGDSGSRELNRKVGEIAGWDKGYEAFVFVDSNSYVSGNYLEVMNYYLSKGSEVIQSTSLKFVDPQESSNDIFRISSILNDYIKPMGRKVLGFDSVLNVNGVCISAEILKENFHKNWIVSSWMDFGIGLQLSGVNIDFAPECCACLPGSEYREENQFSSARSMRNKLYLLKKYFFSLLTLSFKKRSFSYIDTLFELLSPSTRFSVSLVVFFLLSNAVLSYLGWPTLLFFGSWIIILGFGVLLIFVGLRAARAERELYKSLILWPFSTFMDKTKSTGPGKMVVTDGQLMRETKKKKSRA